MKPTLKGTRMSHPYPSQIIDELDGMSTNELREIAKAIAKLIKVRTAK